MDKSNIKLLSIVVLSIILMLIGTASADTIIDDFNRANAVNNLGPNWTHNYAWDINNQKARVDTGASRATYDNYTGSDSNVSVEVSEVDGDLSNADVRFGIVFHAENLTTTDYNTVYGDRYYVLFLPQSEQIILYRVNGSFHQIGATATSKAVGNSSILKVDTSTMSSGLKVYKNGTILHTFSAGDSYLTSGGAGLSSTSIIGGHEVFFDNFTIEYTAVSGDPVISGISNQTANATVGYIDCTTDVNCDATVEYSTNADMSSSKWVNETYDWPSNDSTTHTIKMIRLDASTQYYYRVWVWDSSDSSNVTNSSTQTYTTAAGQTWIDVSTSESPQHAVDNLYPYGTANLSTGIHDISDVIWITAYNITLEGQTISSTIINLTAYNYSAIEISLRPCADTEKRFDEVTMNTTLKNFTIDGYSKFILGGTKTYGIGGQEASNISISNVAMHDLYYGIYFLGAKYTPVPADSIYAANIDIDNVTVYTTISGIRFGFTDVGTVSNSHVYSGQNWLIMLNAANRNWTINNNLLHTSGNSGISLYSSSTDNLVENNTIYSTGTEGINVLGAARSIIQNNTIYNVLRAGIRITSIYTNDDVIIRNNVIYRCGSIAEGYGIQSVDGSGDGVYSDVITIESNTITKNYLGGINYVFDGLTQFNITNNIITGNTGAGYGIDNKTSNKLYASYNNVYNNSGGNLNNTDGEPGNISVNPLFYDFTANDFHLKSVGGRWNGSAWVIDGVTSSCIDAGNPADDYSNEPAPNGSRINMGAYGDTDEASKSTAGITYNISGVVTDDGSNPLVCVTVSDNLSVDSNISYGAGVFNLTGYVNDTYNISFTKSGYDTGYLEVTISGADNITANKQINATVSAVEIFVNPPFVATSSAAVLVASFFYVTSWINRRRRRW